MNRALLTCCAALLASVATVAVAPAGATAGPSPSRRAAHPWDSDNLSPHSRTIKPAKVYTTTGTVTSPGAVLAGRPTRISGTGSGITLDFGKDVAGTVSLAFADSTGPQQVGLAFSESSDYVGDTSDASTGGPRNTDGSLLADVNGRTSYTTPIADQRGGFRYLTIYLVSAGSVDLNQITVHFTPAPDMSRPDDYANYFYSSDPLLNRIWYAGAYTLQLDTIDPTAGRTWPAPDQLWSNTGVVGVGDTVLVDGAKRDRTVWPGDLGIEIPTAYAAFDDTTSARNALTTLYEHQKDTGELPYAGPELDMYGSDTYHLWTLAATYDYVLYSNDRAWLRGIWPQYQKAVDFSLAKVDSNGLLSITETSDSVRSLAKGENLIANVLLWQALDKGATLAQLVGDTTQASAYAAKTAALRTAVNAHLWDSTAGAYLFYPNSTIHPQAGNSLAVWYGLADASQAATISKVLQTNWTPEGSTAPENKGNPGVFSGSLEVNAHFAADNPQADQAGVDLIRREWGFMLNNPEGTNSTFWESYRNPGDGCLFCSNYVSLAHGWATGPTEALTSYVLGLAPRGSDGASYGFVPHSADLQFAQGRITTTHGAVDASWSIKGGSYRATLQAPRGTSGLVGIPTQGRNVSVWLDGHLVWSDGQPHAAGVRSDGEYVYLDGLGGGRHTVISAAA